MIQPLIPANAGTQIARSKRSVGEALSLSRPFLSHSIWVPAFAGMSGV